MVTTEGVKMNVEGKVCIVTGAAGGIGAAIAEAFLKHGGKVVITDLDADRLETTRAHLATLNADVVCRAGNAADPGDIDASIALAQESFGAPVDVYVANAGVGLGIDLADEAAWATALDVNVMAHVRAAQALVPGWVERGAGYFVSTASAAGLLTQLGSATYATSKHAALAFAEWLAVSYGDKGVGVSCLCPMGVETNLLTDVGAASSVAQRAVTESGPVLSPAQVAQDVLDAMAAETFLVLPHANVLDMYRAKGADYDRWIVGMQRFGAHLASGPA